MSWPCPGAHPAARVTHGSRWSLHRCRERAQIPRVPGSWLGRCPRRGARGAGGGPGSQALPPPSSPSLDGHREGCGEGGAPQAKRDRLWTQGPPLVEFPGVPGSHPTRGGHRKALAPVPSLLGLESAGFSGSPRAARRLGKGGGVGAGEGRPVLPQGVHPPSAEESAWGPGQNGKERDFSASSRPPGRATHGPCESDRATFVPLHSCPHLSPVSTPKL